MNLVNESPWKILACDLDGTIIGWKHKINDRDLDALRRAKAAGIHVAIATGRNVLESAGIIRALALDGPGVFVNGATVADMSNGRSLYCQFIPDELIHEAIDFFGSRNHAVLVLAADPETRLPSYVITDHGPPHRATTEWLLANRIHALPVDQLPPNFAGRMLRAGIVMNTDQAAEFHGELQHHFAHRAASHSIYSPHFDCHIIEFFHPAVNKWHGLVHLARLLNADPAQIITIGDDINDLAMLQHASLSFAMGDAPAHVQSAAKRVTAPQSECGVAQVVDALLNGSFDRSPDF